ncbi:MAG: thioredoxin family protein [Paludibacteraceae bacterium]|nr:thioredoxin family protein [Paludibacteraceae bacterium]
MKKVYFLLMLLSCVSVMNGQRRITEEQWDELKITKPVILEFYADWCAPCKQQGSIIARLAQEFPEIDFYKVNIDREKDWFSYETRDGAIPMIQFIFKTDDRNNFYSRATISGFMPYAELRDSCQSILRRFNEIQRKKNIPQTVSTVVKDTIIDIDGVKYHLALSGAVDMGMNVRWAACNVGASSPDKFGDYYSWGEIEPKSKYEWGNYKYVYPGTSNNPRFKKYGPTIDRFDRLQIADDVAKQKWGGKWRMPLKFEMKDLVENTIWQVFKFRGVWGCIAYSEKTKNAIFFPLAGCKTEEGLVDVETSANMWAMDMLYTENSVFDYYEYPKFAYALIIDEQVSVQEWARFLGFSVRPVYDEHNHLN